MGEPIDIIERAQRLLRVTEPSISGSDGHKSLLAAASALINGFLLDDGTALSLLMHHFNPRCDPPWDERDLQRKVNEAKRLGPAGRKSPGYLLGGKTPSVQRPVSSVAGAPPVKRVGKRQQFDPAALKSMMVRGFDPTSSWLAERSPIDPRDVTPQSFLDTIFKPKEKTLIFLKFFSQGELGHVAGDPGTSYYVYNRPGLIPAVAANFPKTSREGAWFLPSPIDGKWYPSGRVDDAGNPILTRRSGSSVRHYRHLLLESDKAPEEEWMNVICQLALPISAIYTSGGRSIHALVRIEAGSKGMFDAFRDRISPLLSKLGTDAAAISGVRLTRLPGVMREGTTDADGKYHKYDKPRLQRLLYLNPAPEVIALKVMPRLRVVESEQKP